MRQYRNMSQKSQETLLVAIQFVLLVAILFSPKGIMWSMTPELSMLAMFLTFGGLAITVIGIFALGPAMSVMPSPSSKGQLKTTGIYSKIRHPIYSGLVVMAVGICVSNRSIVPIVATILLALLFAVKARFEEKLLFKTYTDYAAYARRTGRFIPRVGRITTPEP